MRAREPGENWATIVLSQWESKVWSVDQQHQYHLGTYFTSTESEIFRMWPVICVLETLQVILVEKTTVLRSRDEREHKMLHRAEEELEVVNTLN